MSATLPRLPICLFLLVGLTSTARGEPLQSFTEPYRQVNVSLGEPGIISFVDVEPGSKVTKGDLLVALDTSVLKASLDVAKFRASETSSIDAAQAELKVRTERLQQLDGLRSKGHATESSFQRAYADVQIASARLKIADREILAEKLECKRIEAQIAMRQARSPINGVVAAVHREVGEAVLLNDPKVVTLVQLDKLRIRFPLPPTVATRLQPSQPITVTLPDLISRQVSGKIDRIAPLIDAKSGTVEVTVVINNADQQLRSGTRCLLSLETLVRSKHAGLTPRVPPTSPPVR